ncbi:hypothetical protein [Actinoallomurus soli]|uniref:hypothetical protein n=1 Tax=Actinoallomurus soli TaxID=2952535 RepID=UPI0020922F67|nr:hypothetical protein [Actinoallomurus soli]MCO5969258.1 hypothetical protein [Actinoallomurus soli]
MAQEFGARLFAMEARALAVLRRVQDCEKAILRAEAALNGIPTPVRSPWVNPFGEAALSGEVARCMYELGRFAEVESHARRVIELRPHCHVRSRAFAQLLLVAALVRQGRPDEACVIAGEVISAAQALTSSLVMDQLKDVTGLLVLIVMTR